MDLDNDETDDQRISIGGVFSLPAAEGESHEQLHLTIDDMKKELPTLIGAPVRVEHGDEVVGTVESVEIDDQRRIRGIVKLNSDYTGKRALRKCRNGEYTGFSLGVAHEAGVDENGPRINGKYILHVALAKTPEFADHTVIDAIGETTPMAKINARVIKLKAEQLRRKLGVSKKQAAGFTPKPSAALISTVHSTQSDTTQRPLIVSTSSATSTIPPTMSAASELDKQIAELQAQREAAMQAEKLAAQETAGGVDANKPPQHSWQQTPSSNQSPIVINVNGTQATPQQPPAAAAPTTLDPFAGVTAAELAEFRRQKEERAAFDEQQRASEAAADAAGRRTTSAKRSRDEDTQDDIALTPASDSRDAEIERMRREIGELKAARASEEQASIERPSDKTQAAMDSIKSKLAAKTEAAPGASAVEEDTPVEEIDASTLKFEDINAQLTELAAARRTINDTEKAIKLLTGTARQNKQDELDRTKREFKTASDATTARFAAYITRQLALSGQGGDQDDDITASLAETTTRIGGPSISDISSMRAMGRLVTVSHSNAQNTMAAANEQLQQQKQRFAAERLKMQAEAERAKIAAERSNARLSIASVDPQRQPSNAPPTSNRGPPVAATPSAVPRAAPAHADDPSYVYMRQTGLSARLVAPDHQVAPGQQVFTQLSAANPLQRLPEQFLDEKNKTTHNLRRSLHAPRVRNGAQRLAPDDLLANLSRARAHMEVGAADKLDNMEFSGKYQGAEDCTPVDGNATLSRMNF